MKYFGKVAYMLYNNYLASSYGTLWKLSTFHVAEFIPASPLFSLQQIWPISNSIINNILCIEIVEEITNDSCVYGNVKSKTVIKYNTLLYFYTI